jgi:hypothetical protein
MTIGGEQLAAIIRAGEAKGITDGSCKSNKGSVAVVIVTPDGIKGACGMNITPGPSEAQCSYRSKASGITGLLLLLCKILHNVCLL